MLVILPGLTENYILNMKFLDYYFNHPETWKYPNVNFSVRGNLPQVSWAGERNNIKNLVFYEEFSEMFSNYHKKTCSIILDCSSLLINELNDYDCIGMCALNILNNHGDSGIIVSTDYAYDYFHKNFPFCRMIASPYYRGEKEFFLKMEWPDIPNQINAKYRATYKNNLCSNCSIEQRCNCFYNENLNTGLFSKETIYNDCDILNTNLHNFIFQDDSQHGDIIVADYTHYPMIQLQEYLKLLIKPEYINEIFNYLMLRGF